MYDCVMWWVFVFSPWPQFFSIFSLILGDMAAGGWGSGEMQRGRHDVTLDGLVLIYVPDGLCASATQTQ